MPELDKHDSPLPTTTVKWRFPSVHPEGRKYVVGGGAPSRCLALLSASAISSAGCWSALTIWVAAFFRDPVRTTPRGDKLIVAPADGLITMIAKVAAAARAARRRWPRRWRIHARVDFHERVRRAHQPLADLGRVKRIAYVPGQVRQCRSRQGERGQ